MNAVELSHLVAEDLLKSALVLVLGFALVALFLALNWVNPLAWIALRQSVRYREEACDEAVVRQGHDSRDHADLLLRQARTASASVYFSAATSVVEPGTAEGRVRRVLNCGGRWFERSCPIHLGSMGRAVRPCCGLRDLFAGMADSGSGKRGSKGRGEVGGTDGARDGSSKEADRGKA